MADATATTATKSGPAPVTGKVDPEFEAAERQLALDNRPITGAELRAFGQEISRGITEGMAALVPRKVTIGDYMRRHRPKVVLKCQLVQNGGWVQPHTLSDEERDLANQIHRSGRYLKRRVEVQVHVNPVDENDRIVDIRYPDARVDQRLENARYFSGLDDLLGKIVAEQNSSEAADKAEEDAALARRAAARVDRGMKAASR